MKKILLPALLIGLLTACSDDNADSNKTNQALLGKWQPLKEELLSGNTVLNTQVLEPENNSCPDYNEFKSDGISRSVDLDGNCEQKWESSSAYTFDGTIVKITSTQGEVSNFKVLSISSSELILEQTFSQGGGTYKDKITLKKLK